MCHQLISISKQFRKPDDCCSQDKNYYKIKGRPEAIKFNLILSLDYARIKYYEAS